MKTIDLEDKEAILASGLDGVFTISHFDGYAAVLVALDEADPDQLRELVLDGWLATAPPGLGERHGLL